MLYNEINLVKLLDDKMLINYHLHSTKFNYEKAICFEILVKKDFDLEINKTPYNNEYVLKQAFSLLYKNSPFDGTGLLNYIFGDFCLKIDKLEKSINSEYDNLINLPDYVIKFNQIFNLNKKNIFDFLKTVSENIEKTTTHIFVHFNLTECLNVNNWHEINNILKILDSWFIESRKSELFTYNKKLNNYSLSKSFLPTVCSGEMKNDMQFPGFDKKNSYKTFVLCREDLWIVYYHKKVMEALIIKTINIPKGSTYNFLLIPSGNIEKESLQNFIDKILSINDKNKDSLSHENPENELSDDIFMSIQNSILSLDCLALLDIVLVQKGERTNVVMSEISNISRDSLLKNIEQLKIAASILPKLLQEELNLKKEFELKYCPNFYKAFFNIHAKNKQNYKKFLNWLFKIFMGQKNFDQELLEVFVNRIFKEIKTNGNVDYLRFLISFKLLQQLNRGEIMDLEFKKLGEYCGSIACPVSYVIGNFEASKVCQLKQVTSVDDVLELLNDMMTSLILHRKDKNNANNSTPEQFSNMYDKAGELIVTLKERQFEQDSFIIGFFTAYFKGRRFEFVKQTELKQTESKEPNNEQE